MEEGDGKGLCWRELSGEAKRCAQTRVRSGREKEGGVGLILEIDQPLSDDVGKNENITKYV